MEEKAVVTSSIPPSVGMSGMESPCEGGRGIPGSAPIPPGGPVGGTSKSRGEDIEVAGRGVNSVSERRWEWGWGRVAGVGSLSVLLSLSLSLLGGSGFFCWSGSCASLLELVLELALALALGDVLDITAPSDVIDGET